MKAKCGTELKPGQLVAFMTRADLKIGKVDKLTPLMVKIFPRKEIWDPITRSYTGTHDWGTYPNTVKPEHIAVIHAESPDYLPAGTPPPGAGARLP